LVNVYKILESTGFEPIATKSLTQDPL